MQIAATFPEFPNWHGALLSELTRGVLIVTHGILVFTCGLLIVTRGVLIVHVVYGVGLL